MDQAPRSPAQFHLTATGRDIADVFTGPQPSAPDRQSRSHPRLPHYVDSANAWWNSIVPVAATGWGALAVIAPMIAIYALGWATRARRSVRERDAP